MRSLTSSTCVKMLLKHFYNCTSG